MSKLKTECYPVSEELSQLTAQAIRVAITGFSDDDKLSREERMLVRDLVKSLADMLHKLRKFSTSSSTLSRTGETYDLQSTDEELNPYIQRMIQHINDFGKTKDIQAFKISCDDTLNMPWQHRKSNLGLIAAKIHDAIVHLFRSFFRLFDYIATFIARRDQTKDAYGMPTPLAQKTLKRDQFFEYSKTPKTDLINITNLKKEFTNALDKLENLTPMVETKIKPV